MSRENQGLKKWRIWKLDTKRGQTTLEYVYLIGVAAVALIAALVYVSRGFQGNVRLSSDQIGAGQYDPQNMNVNNVEVKHSISKITSKGSSTTIYGNDDGSNPNKSTDTSDNYDETTVETTRHTDESLGSFKNDAWN